MVCDYDLGAGVGDGIYIGHLRRVWDESDLVADEVKSFFAIS